MTSTMNDAHHVSANTTAQADDLEPAVIAHWSASVHDDLGDTVEISTID